MDGRDESRGEAAAGSDEHGPADPVRADDGATELQDASLAEPPPPAPEPRDGFDAVDTDRTSGTEAPATPAEAPPTPAEAPAEAAETAVERDLNYQAFQQRARLAEDRLAEVLAGYRQLKKETEEHKVRVTKNTERRFEQRHERLMLKFVDILDNLDRALDAAERTYAGEALIQGLILVRTQLLQTLKDEGLERIPVLGLAFDPNVSEAIGTEPVAEPEQDNLVRKEPMRGYRLHGRVVRASRVVVGTYQPPTPGKPAEDAAPADAPAEAEPPAPEPTPGSES